MELLEVDVEVEVEDDDEEDAELVLREAEPAKKPKTAIERSRKMMTATVRLLAAIAAT